jgi:epoxyqueuosine reductase QueG
MGEGIKTRGVYPMESLDLKHWLISQGAAVAGVAELEELSGYPTLPENLIGGYRRGVSMGIPIPKGALADVHTGPNPLYLHAYETVNRLLDDLAMRTASLLESVGGKALAIPASHTLDRNVHRGSLSHKAVARLAGLGWIGKNILLVNPEYGPRLRFATVLTDLELEPDAPLDRDCGGCTKCTDACPAGAIKGVIAKPYPATREVCLDLAACVAKLAEFKAELGKDICGVCIRVCPFAKV